MNYVLKFLVALALAVFALPWPATVLIRGFAMSVDFAMSWLVANAKVAKDSGAKAGSLLLSALLVLTGIWPAALLLAFLTVWHERGIIWLFVKGLNLEDTRVHNTQGSGQEPPPQNERQPARLLKLPPSKDQLLTTPQAIAASKACGWDPVDNDYRWSAQHQCWVNDEEAVAINGDRIGWIQNGNIKQTA